MFRNTVQSVTVFITKMYNLDNFSYHDSHGRNPTQDHHMTALFCYIFLAIFWPLTDPLIILFCKPVDILEKKLSVCLITPDNLLAVLYEYDIA